MNTAIVTGATGMIAAALIRRLIREGVRVYALCKPGIAGRVDVKHFIFTHNQAVLSLEHQNGVRELLAE